jgi:hypothetical protein
MRFRRKLLAVFALTVFLSVAAVAVLVLTVTRRAFEKNEEQRTAALVAQFQREFNRQGEDIARRVEAIAASEAVSGFGRIFRSCQVARGEPPTRFPRFGGRTRNDHFVGAVAGKVRISRGRV